MTGEPNSAKLSRRIRLFLGWVFLLGLQTLATGQPLPVDQVDPRSFGAKCDAKTDDSMALQNAIDAAISQSKQLMIPSGTCVHSETLRLNVNNVGLNLAGRGGQGSGASLLKYTGRQTGYTATTAVGNKFVYSLSISDVGFLAGSETGAQIGLDARNLSESSIERVGWASFSGNSKTGWKTVLRCIGCNIININRFLAQNANTVFDLQGAAAIFIQGVDLFRNSIPIHLSGACTHIVVRDGWMEMQDIAILVDTVSGNTSIDGLFVSGNRFLFNAQSGFVAPSQIAIKFVSQGSHNLSTFGFEFHDNTVYFAPGLTNVSYAVVAQIDQSAQGNVSLNVHNNSFIGASRGIATSNRPDAVTWNFHENYSVDSKRKPHDLKSSQ